jgi:hypothetical protein
MATATQLRDGLWLIEWNADLTSKRFVGCYRTFVQLTCDITNYNKVHTDT